MKLRWAMFVLGMWIGGSLCMVVVATQNFRTIDRLLAGSPNATFRSQITTIGQPVARDFLRYLSSELNRLYFQLWNAAQIVLGLLSLWLLAGQPALAKARWGVAGMVAIVALMTAWLQPEITAIGRSLDFVPRDPRPPAADRFWILHGAYTALELSKLLVGLIVTFWIGRS